MSRHLGNLASIAVLAVLFASCDDNRIAGGTTETDNMVTARTIRVDSLLPEWNHPGWASTVATLRLDSTNMRFSATSADGGSVVVETMDSLRLPFRVVFWDTSARRGRIQVRLDPWLQRPGSKFRLRWGLPDSGERRFDGRLEGNPRQPEIGPDFRPGGRLRGVVAPVPASHRTGMEFPFLGSPPPSRHPSSRTRDRVGRATPCTFNYSAPIQSGYAYVGVPLGGNRSLRSLDSIVFWARGTKTILTLAFDHQGATDIKAWTPRHLDSTWTRYSIRPSDLDSATGVGGNVGWLGVRDSVTNISFFLAQGSDLWLDDVRLFGIDRDDLR